MKRGLLIVALGAVGAVAAFCFFYLMGTATPRALMQSARPELASLKHEFNLGDAEFERDREYFTKAEGFTAPIAVPERQVREIVDGRPLYWPDRNLAAYKVGGIPQIHLIDKQGKIRLIMTGYDDTNESKLSEMIEALLKGM